MTKQQQQAADPKHSCWVSANAGTGKTKVLVDRVLRLMLDGARPSTILCLTYTNAAAREMESRLLEMLKGWSRLEEKALVAALSELTGESPSSEKTAHARSLYQSFLENERPTMGTIHQFCLTLLRYFPFEAGLSPDMTLLNERESMLLMQEAKQRLMLDTQNDELRQALSLLALHMAPKTFHELLEKLVAARKDIAPICDAYGAGETYRQALYEHYALDTEVSDDAVIERFIHDAEIARLRALSEILAQGKATDQKHAEKIRRFCEAPQEAIEIYASVFRRSDGGPADVSRLMTKDLRLANPSENEWMLSEQQRVLHYLEEQKARRSIALSNAVYMIADSMLALYDALKREKQAMDFEDVILAARRLLWQSETASWVLYQLDQRIDHILLDEAQDTSPEQWALIESLTSEFFVGEGSRDTDAPANTLFVVGDYKQSIYSFQGARPELFVYYQHAYAQQAEAAQETLKAVELDRSFRSTPQILSFVDHLFSTTGASEGVLLDLTSTHAAHRHDKGYVELWPLVKCAENEEIEPWAVPADYVRSHSAIEALADKIAGQIQNWLRSGRMLAAKGRSVRAGDIMILVRHRNPLYHAINAALLRHDIPLAGQDRLDLQGHLVVHDLLAVAKFLLLPDDDYTLACVLKSPLYRVSEEQLFQLCHEREGSLWQRIKEQQDNSICQMVYEELSALLSRAGQCSYYELYTTLLSERNARERFSKAFGAEGNQMIDAFMSQLRDYEHQDTVSLHEFIQLMESSTFELKQDMSSANDCVRVMTVHGAKGLQAPIVIMPDTVSKPELRHDSLCFSQTDDGAALFEYWPSATMAPEKLTRTREAMKIKAHEEYHRLLYVAMTRAEDELYLCGAAPSRGEAPENCWYHYASESIRSHADAIAYEEEGEQGYRIGSVSDESGGAVTENTNDVMPIRFDPVPPAEKRWQKASHLHARSEAGSQEPSNPLHGLEAYDAALLGTVVHHLLEHLPSVLPNERPQAARALLSAYGLFSVEECEVLQAHVMNVLNAPGLAWVFDHDFENQVYTEMPLIGEGESKNQSVHRIIDRLVVTPKIVWIIDYKTDQAKPEGNIIPEIYRAQLSEYQRLVVPLYPHLQTRSAIIWTRFCDWSEYIGEANTKHAALHA